MTHSETYKDCTINGVMVDGEEVVTWTDTFGTTWKARFWAHAKREIDKFDQMVERKWAEGDKHDTTLSQTDQPTSRICI